MSGRVSDDQLAADLALVTKRHVRKGPWDEPPTLPRTTQAAYLRELQEARALLGEVALARTGNSKWARGLKADTVRRVREALGAGS